MTPTLTKLLEDLRSGAVRLVSGEATEAMETAHFEAHARAKTVFADVSEIWSAMLYASPDLTPALVEMIEGLVRERDEALTQLDDETRDYDGGYEAGASDMAAASDAALARALAAEAERDALREGINAALRQMPTIRDPKTQQAFEALRALTMETNDG